jgi:hypothetical protein
MLSIDRSFNRSIGVSIAGARVGHGSNGVGTAAGRVGDRGAGGMRATGVRDHSPSLRCAGWCEVVGLSRGPRVPAPTGGRRRGDQARTEIHGGPFCSPVALASDLVDATGGTAGPELRGGSGASGSLADRPLIVQTRGRVDTPAAPSSMDLEYAAYMQVWMHEIQPKLARLSTRGGDRSSLTSAAITFQMRRRRWLSAQCGRGSPMCERNERLQPCRYVTLGISR